MFKTAPRHLALLAIFLAPGCQVGDEDVIAYEEVDDGALYAAGEDILRPGDILLPDQALNAEGGFLVYQSDGNLVLYRERAWGPVFPVWASNTAGTSPGFTAMQGDGNLVVYDGDGNAVWDSGTWGTPGSYAVVRANRVYRDFFLYVFPVEPYCHWFACFAQRRYGG